MRRSKLFFVIFLSIFFMGNFIHNAFGEKKIANPSDGRVIAYYFHGKFRCYTCRTMEQYSKEAIEANFKDALASGKLEFKVVNTEESGNEHYVKDYQLYTKSLVLSLIKNGKEAKSKNLTKIWECSGNKQKFFDYVSEEVNNFLKEAQ